MKKKQVFSLALIMLAIFVLCGCVTLTLNENGVENEALQYENGTGSFTLLSTNELRWQDDTGHAADDALFIALG